MTKIIIPKSKLKTWSIKFLISNTKKALIPKIISAQSQTKFFFSISFI